MTVLITIEALDADPPGHLIRALVRRDDRDVDVIGPEFMESIEAVHTRLAAVLDEVLKTMEGTR